MPFSISILLEELNAPISNEAAEEINQLLKKLKVENNPVENLNGIFTPISGKPWTRASYYDLSHPNIPRIDEDDTDSNFQLTFFPTQKENRGNFILRVFIPEYEQDKANKSILNERSAFLVKCAEEWIKHRKVKLSYFVTSEAIFKSNETAGQDFPRAVGWWNWYNEEITEKVGKENLLSAPIFKAYELANGVAWQLTEDLTEKPKPALLKELKSLLPGNHPLRIVMVI